VFSIFVELKITHSLFIDHTPSSPTK